LTGPHRTRVVALVLLTVAGPAHALEAATAEPQALERAWHICLREAVAHQPPGQSRAGNERNALDECRDREDAYVAALMADRPAKGWARTWAALVEPLAVWIGLARR
jgi:hypothetical protein